MLKIENAATLVPFAFYIVAGIIFLAVLPLSNFPPHIGIIGILSLLTAYGLIRKRFWTLWIAVMLLFIATTFSIVTFYYSFGEFLLLDISLAAYLILTWIFTVYVAMKRRTLES